MDINVKGEFSFEPVGQGCFYNGTITVGDREYSVVYDCGSSSGGSMVFTKSAINKYWKRRKRKYIDILVISHLDEDHYNAISCLLENGTKVGIMILPFITRVDTTLLTAKDVDGRRYNEKYLSFLIDPVGELKKYAEIIIFSTRDNIDDYYNDERLNIENYKDIEISGKICKKEKELISKYFDNDDIDNFRNVYVINKLKISIKCRSSIQSNIWEFYFYQVKSPKKTKEILNFYRRLIIEDIKFSNAKELCNLLNDKEKRAILHKAYKELISDSSVNDTSVIMMHYPLLHIMSGCLWWRREDFNNVELSKMFRRGVKYRCTPNDDNKSSLLLGDITLGKFINEIEFFVKKTCKGKACYVALVPHHGSKKSWDNKATNKLRAKNWIVSAGVHGKFGHPSYDVTLNITKAIASNRSCCEHLIWCNEYVRVAYVFK